MKSILIFVFAVAINSACRETDNNKKPALPSQNSNSKKIDSSHSFDSLFFISSGSMSPYKTIYYNNVPFQLVTNSDGDTIFLGTRERLFITPEGYNVGTSFRMINKKFRANIRKEPGWGYYITLPSKWKLQFHEGNTATEHLPTDTSKVVYVFKRE